MRSAAVGSALLMSAVLVYGCGAQPAPTAVPTTLGPTQSAELSPTPATSSTPTPPPAVTSGPPVPTPTVAATSSPAAGLPQGSEPVTIDPANFTTVIDNPWWPMTVGSVWTYRETDAEGTVAKVVVTVTNDTKEILGVTTVVVHDVLTEDGTVVEDTFDWYAQDLDGNIWYFGEQTKEFTDAGVDTSGSWEAGVDGAYPGVIVPAAPQPGLTYREEYLAGEAEDQARVLSVDEQVEVAAGSYTGLLMTKNYTPVEPDVVEYKWYAQGVGQVLAISVSGGSDREELTDYAPATP